MKRFFAIETVFFLACWAMLSLIYRERAFVDPGALWHIRVGERILDHGFMTTDPFTFTFEGHTWIPQKWLGEVAMALAHRIGGLDAMLLGFSLGLSALFTGVFHLARQNGMGTPLAAIVAIGTAVTAGFHFYLRPHLVTIAFTAITYTFIVNYDRGRIARRSLYWLVPLHALWTNFHGGMLGGLMMMTLYAGWQLRRRDPFLLWIVCLSALTMFLNPIGLELQRTWFRIVGSGSMARYVTEHTPLDWHRPGDQLVLGYAAVYLLVIATTPVHHWRFTMLIPVIWLVLTLRGIRHGPLFVMTAAIAIIDSWPVTRLHAWLRGRGDWLTRDSSQPLSLPGVKAFVLPAILAIMSMALIQMHQHVPLLGSKWARVPASLLPVEMAPELRARLKPGDRIFNDANFGGFLIYFVPDVAIFMDDRFELYGDRWLDRYVEMMNSHPEQIEQWREQYRFRYALVAASEATSMDGYLNKSDRWTEISRTNNAVLYQSRTE